MTKAELQEKLLSGGIMDDLFSFRSGQNCLIFKADEFVLGDDIIYIPDTDLNEIPIEECPKTISAIAEIIHNCYTGNDFLEECGGDGEKAKRLFGYCDWQHPSSAVLEIDEEEY